VSRNQIEELANVLWSASETRIPCAPLTEEATFSLEDAYAVQKHNIERRLADGASLVGRKIGLTSFAIQEWLQVDEPDFGGLLDTMVVPNGGCADTGALLQPRAEGELAFVFGSSLKGPGVSPAQVIASTDFVLPAIEIVDSRVRDWKITLEDTVADNASSGMFVLGSKPGYLTDFNTRTVGLTLRKNGASVSTGVGAACMGDPVNAVTWLVNKLGTLGSGIEQGEVILSGALGPVTPVEKGDWLTATIGDMADVVVRFE